MSLIKVITMKFDPVRGGFDENVLESFYKDHEVISVKEYFFKNDGSVYLSFVLSYQPFSGCVKNRRATKKEEFSLTEAEIGLFSILRQ